MQLGYHMPTEQLAPDNAFVVGFIQALVRAAAQRGHHVLVFTEHGDELEVFRELVANRGVDGFILSGSRVDDPRVRFLAEAAIPSAMFGRTAPDLPQTWVDIDNVAAVGAMVDYLVERGHREFAYSATTPRTSGIWSAWRATATAWPATASTPPPVRSSGSAPPGRSTGPSAVCSTASTAPPRSSPATTCWRPARSTRSGPWACAPAATSPSPASMGAWCGR
jgi:hypothetical protein